MIWKMLFRLNDLVDGNPSFTFQHFRSTVIAEIKVRVYQACEGQENRCGLTWKGVFVGYRG